MRFNRVVPMLAVAITGVALAAGNDPQALKQNTLPTLQAAKTQYPALATQIQKAIDHIGDSLLDDRHLADFDPVLGDDVDADRPLFLAPDVIDPERGRRVFHEEATASDILLDLIRDKKTPAAAKGALQGVVNDLVAADQGIAAKTLADAKTFLGGKANPDVRQAERNFAQAVALAAQGKSTLAIERFQDAWEAAKELAAPHLALAYLRDLRIFLNNRARRLDQIDHHGDKDARLKEEAEFIARRAAALEAFLSRRAEGLAKRLGITQAQALAQINAILGLLSQNRELEQALVATIARLEALAAQSHNPATQAALRTAADALRRLGTAADRTPPVIADLLPPEGSFAPSTPTLSAAFSDALSGVDPASIVILLNGTNVTAQAHATASGFSYSPTLSDGNYTLAVSVADKAGNVASATRHFSIDTTPPQITSLVPADGSFTKLPRPTISASYQDATSGVNVASVHLTLDGQDVTAQANVTAFGLSFTPGTDLPEGAHTVYVSVSDRAGNVATAQARWIADFTQPTIAIIDPANGSVSGTATPFMHVSYSDAGSGVDLSTLVIMLDGMDETPKFTKTATAATFTPGTMDALANGAHTLKVRILDKAGNETAAQSSFSVQTGQTDTTPPVVTIIFPQRTFFGNPTAFEGSAWKIVADARDPGPSASGIRQVTFLVDGVSVGAATSFPYETQVTFPSGIAGQSKVLTAVAQDNAGNSTTSDPVTIQFVSKPSSGAIVFRASGGPTTIQAGQPFPNPITIEAIDAQGQVDPNYTGRIFFFTSDPASSLNGFVTASFGSADQGVIHVDFSQLLFGSAPLYTAGPQTIAMADLSNPARDQGVILVNVTPGPPALVSIVSGADQDFTASDQLQPIGVDVTDAFGNEISGQPVQLQLFEDGVLTSTLQGTTDGPVVFTLPPISSNTLVVGLNATSSAVQNGGDTLQRVAQRLSFSASIINPPNPLFMKAGDKFTLSFTAFDEQGLPLQQTHPNVMPQVNLIQGESFGSHEFQGSVDDLFTPGVPLASDGTLQRDTFFTRIDQPHVTTFELQVIPEDPNRQQASISLQAVIAGPAVQFGQAANGGYQPQDRFRNPVYGAELVASVRLDGNLVDTVTLYSGTTEARFGLPAGFDLLFARAGGGALSFDVALASDPSVTLHFDGGSVSDSDSRPSQLVNLPIGQTSSLPPVHVVMNTIDRNISLEFSGGVGPVAWMGIPTISPPAGFTVTDLGLSQDNRVYTFRLSASNPPPTFTVDVSGSVTVAPNAVAGNLLLVVDRGFAGYELILVGTIQKVGFAVASIASDFIDYVAPVSTLPGFYDGEQLFNAQIATLQTVGDQIQAHLQSLGKDGSTVLFETDVTLNRTAVNRYISAPFLGCSPELYSALRQGFNQYTSAIPPPGNLMPLEGGGSVVITSGFGPGSVSVLGMDVEIDRSTDPNSPSYAPAPFGIFKLTAPRLRYTPLGLGQAFDLYGIRGSEVILRGKDRGGYFIYGLFGAGDLSALQSQGKFSISDGQFLVQPGDLGIGAKNLDVDIEFFEGVPSIVPSPTLFYGRDNPAFLDLQSSASGQSWETTFQDIANAGIDRAVPPENRPTDLSLPAVFARSRVIVVFGEGLAEEVPDASVTAFLARFRLRPVGLMRDIQRFVCEMQDFSNPIEQLRKTNEMFDDSIGAHAEPDWAIGSQGAASETFLPRKIIEPPSFVENFQGLHDGKTVAGIVQGHQHFRMRTYAAHGLVDEIMREIGLPLGTTKIAVVDTGLGNNQAVFPNLPALRLPSPVNIDDLKGDAGALAAIHDLSHVVDQTPAVDNSPPGHGTQAAVAAGGDGVSGLDADGGNGVLGVGKHALLRIIRARTELSERWGSSDATCINALTGNKENQDKFIRDLDIRVVNVSSARVGGDGTLEDAVKTASKAGIIVVMAAGQSGPGKLGLNIDDEKVSPARLAPQTRDATFSLETALLVTVSGLPRFRSPGDSLERWSRSHFGNAVSVAAPAEDLELSQPDGTRDIIAGTSFSAPYVAGLLAEMRIIANEAYAYRLKPETLIELMEATAENPDGSEPTQRTPDFGNGVVNAWKALLSAANGGVAQGTSNPDGTLTVSGRSFSNLGVKGDGPFLLINGSPGAPAAILGTRWYGFEVRVPATLQNATFWIDPDGDGPLPPFQVVSNIVIPGTQTNGYVPLHIDPLLAGPQDPKLPPGTVAAFAGVGKAGVMPPVPVGLVLLGKSNQAGEFLGVFSMQRSDLLGPDTRFDQPHQVGKLMVFRPGESPTTARPVYQLDLNLPSLRVDDPTSTVSFDDFVFSARVPDLGLAVESVNGVSTLVIRAKRLNDAPLAGADVQLEGAISATGQTNQEGRFDAPVSGAHGEVRVSVTYGNRRERITASTVLP